MISTDHVRGQWNAACNIVRQWSELAWDFLLPPACLLCGTLPSRRSGQLCEDCIRRLVPASQEFCQCCAAPVGPNLKTDAGCLFCRSERYQFRRVLTLGEYDGELRRAILAGKGIHGSPVVMALSDLLLDRHLADLLTEPFDAIVPVPHHWGRRWWGIHSASETLGERLAHRLQRRYAPHILRKPRATPRQSLSVPSERRLQQRGAFEVVDKVRLDGARLLLVDDVLTTGATANSAARTLRNAGASDVLVAVLARSVGRRGRASA